jgi:hypothetical protein
MKSKLIETKVAQVESTFPCLKKWVGPQDKKGNLIVMFESLRKGVALVDEAGSKNRTGSSTNWVECTDKLWVDFEGTIEFTK